MSCLCFTGKLVRGVGFEPTKAYATGYLLSRILSQAPSSSNRRGMSCPFGLIPAHEIGLQRHYCSMGLGNPRSQAQANPCGRYNVQTRLDPGDNPRPAPRTSSATSSFRKFIGLIGARPKIAHFE